VSAARGDEVLAVAIGYGSVSVVACVLVAAVFYVATAP